MRDINKTDYKLIALDLDDTLLTAEKEVRPENLQAIARAIRAGVRIVLASGRTIEGMQFVIDAIGHPDYTISAGGAVVTDPDGNRVYSRPVPPETAKKVMKFAATRGAYFQIFSGCNFYFTQRTPYTDAYEKSCRFKGVEDPGIMDWAEVDTSKILIIDTRDRIGELRAEMSTLFPEVKTVYSQSNFLEVINSSASKGLALEFIIQQLGLSKQQVIAIGDSEIDIPMLKAAGVGIAVHNAGEAVLRVADHVTASSEENGVAVAINRFIFGEDK